MKLSSLISFCILGALAQNPALVEAHAMSMLPCDIFGASGTPCVAAHSVVRALYANFTGALYQVLRASDKSKLDISVLSAGGFANAAEQDGFCKGTSCEIHRIYDQAPKPPNVHPNHLYVAPLGQRGDADKAVNASRHQISIGGHTVYGAYFEGHMGYRNDKTYGVATGEEPETIYMVTHGGHYNDECCFDYGNAETDNRDHGKGTMEAVYFGNKIRREHHGGQGDGPWVSVDIESGVWSSGSATDPVPSVPYEFVTAMSKGKKGTMAIKAGNAQGGSLQTVYEGARPIGYEKMKKQGAIILGIGGDNSNKGIGTFYEGAITAGYSKNAYDDMLQANIVAAGYGKSSAVVV